MAALFVASKFSATDANGNPLAGGRVHTYAAGTLTPKATYTTQAGNVANANPVILDSAGRADIWLGSGSYKFVVTDSAGAAAPDGTVDNISGSASIGDLAGSGGSALVGHVAAGTGAVTRTLQAKLRDFVSILDFIPVAEHAAIAAGTSTYDCYGSIVAAIDSVTYIGTFLGGPYVAGPSIYFPPGVYTVNSTIHLKKRVTLWADGSGMAYGDASILKWPASTAGIVIHSRYTDATNSGAFTTGADASVIHGLALVSAGGAGTTYHGIWMRARATIERCYIENFPGNGINVVGQAAYGWDSGYSYALNDVVSYGGVAYKSLQASNLNKTPGAEPAWWVQGATELTGNVNSWRLVGGRVNDCTGHGVYVAGADANAGKADGVDSASNGGWGFYDSSFLGNSYDACHTASNTLGAYKSDNANARNLFTGCYSESGQPASDLTGTATAPGAASSAIVIGGIHAAGFTAGTTAAVLENGIGNFIISRAVTRPELGLDFSTATRSATASILDAYSEVTSNTPTAAGFTVVGTPSYFMRYSRIGNRVMGEATISVSGGTTAATLGTSTLTLPITPASNSVCVGCTDGPASVGNGLVKTDGKLYVPTWSATANAVRVSFNYEVSSTAA